MKIHQLPMGARFEYQGEEYVKTAPLFATGKSGQKLIPKYAVLKPLDMPVVPAAPLRETLPRAEVLAAFESFYAQCQELVPPDAHAALAAARASCIRMLDGEAS